MDITEYKKIVVTLRPSLLSLALRITGNLQDAEDAVQETCLRIWHQRDRFDRYRNAEAYSTSMVRNLCFDKLRSRKPYSDETELTDMETGEQLPDSLMEEKEERDAIRRAIGQLPPLQRRVLQLKDIEGYETGEIARMTGLAPEAVRNNLSRARKRIRELFLLCHSSQTSKK